MPTLPILVSLPMPLKLSIQKALDVVHPIWGEVCVAPRHRYTTVTKKLLDLHDADALHA